MKIHVSRYIVGVTTCVAAQVSYATGIESLGSEDQKAFAKTVQKNMQSLDKQITAGINTYSPYTSGSGDDADDVTFADKIKPLINSKDANEVEDALKLILAETHKGWKNIEYNTSLKKVLIEIYKDLQIDEYKFEVKSTDDLTKENYNKLITAIDSKGDLKKLYLKQADKEFTVKEITGKGGKINAANGILYDESSKVIVSYDPTKYASDTALNFKDESIETKISDEPIGEARLKAILQKNNKCIFFEPGENEIIIDYISNTLAAKTPTEEAVNTILTKLHETPLNAETNESKAIIDYLTEASGLNDDIKNVYKTSTYKLTKGPTIKEHIEKIHNTLHIDPTKYAREYDETTEAAKEKARIKGLGVDLDATTIKYKDKDPSKQIQTLYKYIKHKEAIDKLEKTQAETKKLTEDAKKAENEIQKYKDAETASANEINRYKNELSIKNAEINTIKAELITKDNTIKEQKATIKDYTDYMKDTLGALNIKKGKTTQHDFSKIQKMIQKLKDGTTGAADPQISTLMDDNKAKEKEINDLKTERNDLNNKIVSLEAEITRLTEENTKITSGTGKPGATTDAKVVQIILDIINQEHAANSKNPAGRLAAENILKNINATLQIKDDKVNIINKPTSGKH